MRFPVLWITSAHFGTFYSFKKKDFKVGTPGRAAAFYHQFISRL